MPIDHFCLAVPQSKFEGLITFLTTSLAGFKEIIRPVPNVVGLGEFHPYFWLTGLDSADVDAKTLELALKRNHIAFTAEVNGDVDTFHAAALKAGATCNGPPGPRDHYHPGYYAAFVFDPVIGINIEVVCHNRSA